MLLDFKLLFGQLFRGDCFPSLLDKDKPDLFKEGLTRHWATVELAISILKEEMPLEIRVVGT